jgi:hypothetical protein
MSDAIDTLLEQRGKQYGDFNLQIKTIAKILNRLRMIRDHRLDGPIGANDVENFFLVLKLVRLQTANDPDSLLDLEGYARLIRRRRFPEKEKK